MYLAALHLPRDKRWVASKERGKCFGMVLKMIMTSGDIWLRAKLAGPKQTYLVAYHSFFDSVQRLTKATIDTVFSDPKYFRVQRRLSQQYLPSISYHEPW